MGAEAAQLALFAHHAFEKRTHVDMADQVAEVFGFAVEQRVEPHITDGVESFFPALLAGVLDALASGFGFSR